MWTNFFRSGVKTTCLLISILINNLRLLSQPLPPHWDHLSIEEGLSESYVTCMLQDHLGFMWFGTAEGLNRYDGFQFKTWFRQPKNPNSLSDNLVDALVEDKQGRIWIGTNNGLSCYLPAQDTFVRYSHQATNSNSLSHNKIWSLLIDRQGFIWIGTTDGLNRFDPVRKQFTRFTFRGHNPNGISHPQIRSLYQDRQGLIWIGTFGGGLDVYNPRTNRFRVYRHEDTNPQSLSHDVVTGVHEDRQGRFWVATYGGGLNLMNRTTGTFRAFRHQAGNPKSLGNDEVYTLLEDQKGQFWVGTDGGGLNLMDRSKEVFTRYLPKPSDQYSLSSPVIKSIIQDRQQNLWVGTWLGGINVQYAARPPFREYKPDHSVSQGGQNDHVQEFLEDETGHVWIDYEGGGLSRLDPVTHQMTNFPQATSYGQPPVSSIATIQGKIWKATRTVPWQHWTDPKTGRIAAFLTGNDAFPDERIRIMLEDKQKNWWLISKLNVLRFDYQKRCYHFFRHDPADPNSLTEGGVSALFQDDQQRIWLGVSNGVDQYDPGTQQFFHHPFDQTDKYGRASGISQDRHGILWVTSHNGDLFRLDPRRGRQASMHHQISLGQSTMGVLVDARDRLWISTLRGLLCYDPAHSSINRYDHRDGLQSDEFLFGSLLKARNGLLYFGGINGFDVFDPLQIQTNPYLPPVVLTDFRLANQPVPLQHSLADTLARESPLTEAIPYVNQLELAHNQNDFSFGFAALNYYKPRKNRFRYRLQGYDARWQETDGAQPVAFYTNINPGSYTFEVQAANNDGIWNPKSLTLPILIHRPWWTSYWAYGLYGLGLIGLGYQAFRRYRRRLQLKQFAQQQAYEAEQERQMNAVKSHFFDNITHEFRTPLTLILAPAQLLKEKLYDPAQEAQNHRRLETIDRSAHQLLSLVNQLLSLSKLEAKTLPVVESSGNVVMFVQTIIDSFQTQAETSSIQLTFDPAEMPMFPTYWFDSTKLERIVVNLLANALKFTNAGGAVSVRLKPLATGVQLMVTDTGIGIATDELPRIFDRFYQVNHTHSGKRDQSSQAGPRSEGTGIGLALVHELIQLQKGQITVQSQVGEGTTFTVELPYRLVVSVSSSLTPVDSAHSPGAMNDNPLLLVVDDNPELRQLIADSFPPQYTVLQAANGQDGFEKAIEQIPDLIISDVLMPVMDGYALVHQLKNDWRTSHIPILLLTAKSTSTSRLEGLSLGADDYLSKPFQIEELQWRVQKRIEQIRHLRNWLKTSLVHPEAGRLEHESPNLDPFLVSVYAIVEEHINDSTFEAEALVAALDQSRTSIHRKLKALTGLSVDECIRSYRLKRACAYLQQGLSVTETTFRVGFESPVYFSKAFQEAYHQNPAEFAQASSLQ